MNKKIDLPEHLKPSENEHGPIIFNLGDPSNPECVNNIRQFFETYFPSAIKKDAQDVTKHEQVYKKNE